MEYKEVVGAIYDVQRTLEALALRVDERELKAMAGDAAGKLASARAAIHLRDDRLRHGE